MFELFGLFVCSIVSIMLYYYYNVTQEPEPVPGPRGGDTTGDGTETPFPEIYFLFFLFL